MVLRGAFPLCLSTVAVSRSLLAGSSQILLQLGPWVPTTMPHELQGSLKAEPSASLLNATLKAPFFPCQLLPAGPPLVLGPLTVLQVVQGSAPMSDITGSACPPLDTAQLRVLMAECGLWMVLLTSAEAAELFLLQAFITDAMAYFTLDHHDIVWPLYH